MEVDDENQVSDSEAHRERKRRHPSGDSKQFPLAEWKQLYMSALSMKDVVKAEHMFSSWPPTAKDFDEKHLLEVVPSQLFNLIAWMCTENSCFDQGYVHVPTDVEKKIISISQDILSLRNTKITTPKHLLVGMAARHITGSQRIVKILNGLGHSASQTTLQRLDTAFAECEMKNPLPSTLIRSMFTTLIWDNIDFLEETISGQNTTHCVNGIAVQFGPPPPPSAGENAESDSKTDAKCVKKSRMRKLAESEFSIVHYPKRRRTDPQLAHSTPDTAEEEKATLAGAKQDELYFLLKSMRPESDNSQSLPLPSWTGFNAAAQKDVPLCSSVTYLPVIDGNATEMSTVNTILHRSMDLAEHLDQDAVVVVADQAIYAKAQQIRWAYEDMKKKTVMRLGEFHTLMAFIAAIGEYYCYPIVLNN